jgi:nitric oxide reductase NorD protein
VSPARGHWLQSPHLARADGGAEALALFRRLPEGQQREIVHFGDMLAESSPALALAYALRAPEARAALSRERFALWAKLAVELATGELANREAAAAFLHLDTAAVASCPPALLEHWRRLFEEVQSMSRKLAALFVEGSGPVLAKLAERARPRLDAWVEGGIKLASRSGWRGEFLAAAFFASGGGALSVLDAEEIRRWAALGAAVQVGREVGQQFFLRGLPAGFDSFSAAERAATFDLCAASATRAASAAATLFEILPGAVARIPHEARAALLRALAEASCDAEAIVTLAPMLAAIVQSIPAAAQAALLERVARCGARFPLCLVPLLRSLPRALEQTGVRGLARWIERGEAIADVNLEAGRAYFALESRTALRYLREDSAAVHLEEIHGVLRSYARMLSGRSLTLRSGDGLSLRPFLDRESLERSSIALPERVDFFSSWEDNFSVLKLATAVGVGRLLHGSFELSLARVRARLPAPLASVLATAVEGDGLADLLEAVPEADPLITLFTACDGARIDFRLRRQYRGYAAEIERVARRLVRRVARPRRSAELVLFLIGAGVSSDELPTDDLPVALIGSVAAALRSPESTVDDALAVAIQIRERLVDSIAVSGFGPPTSYEELLFEKVTGDGALDPEPEADSAASQDPRATEVLDLDPAAIEEGDEDGPGSPLSAEELRRLLEAGAILKIGRGDEVADSAGIFARDLPLGGSVDDRTSEEQGIEGGDGRRARRAAEERGGFDYDEWDYAIRDYRPQWCHLDEISLGGDAGEFFQDTLTRYADLLPEVRRQFQRIRPERYLKVRGLEDGEDFDLNAAVEARVELRARRSPTQRLYVARRPQERDVATLFLLDMSASTDEPVQPRGLEGEPQMSGGITRRIIDVTKEALVIMAEALEELGDRYAVYGFSGQGRSNVEFYLVKPFQEGLTARVRGRIGGIEPRRSTRMGTALRHARMKMTNVTARSKHVFLLSDGFPQDFDYGADRRSNTYGIQDTMMALQECQAAGITPFCITVDKTGHDYLRQMCETSRYLVIEDVASLPTELPKIYERWVRA